MVILHSELLNYQRVWEMGPVFVAFIRKKRVMRILSTTNEKSPNKGSENE